MADIIELQARRDALIAKREACVKRVREGDSEVEYDLQQIMAAIRELDKQIALVDGRKITRRVRIMANRGL